MFSSLRVRRLGSPEDANGLLRHARPAGVDPGFPGPVLAKDEEVAEGVAVQIADENLLQGLESRESLAARGSLEFIHGITEQHIHACTCVIPVRTGEEEIPKAIPVHVTDCRRDNLNVVSN